MRSLLEMLGYRRNTYRGSDFSVRVKPRVREGVSITYQRAGAKVELLGERYGKGWNGIQTRIPYGTEGAQAAQMAADLETAFREMNYEHVRVEK